MNASRQGAALANEVLEFWFGATPATADSVASRSRFWFKSDRQFDDEIRQCFGREIDAALGDQLELSETDPYQALAKVLVLDQFPRNVFRGALEAFSGDARALRTAKLQVNTGQMTSLGALECGFLLMPYQHSESLGDQETGVKLFADLPERSRDWEKSYTESFYRYAKLHRDIIRQFGRFPHRNAVLGRESTPAEHAYLDGNGQRFGQ